MLYLNYLHLIHFYHVAQHASFTKAAQELGISQPTLSEQIKLLETSIGHQLFQRNGKQIELSNVGRQVFQHAKSIVDEGNSLIQKVKLGQINATNSLKVGVTNSTPKLIVARVLKILLKIDPNIKIEFQEHEIPTLKQLLVQNELNLLITDEPLQDIEKVSFYQYLIGSSPLAIFTNKQNINKKINLKDLNQKKFILMPKGTSLRSQIDLWFHEKKIEYQMMAEASDTALIKVLGAEGLGFFFSPLILANEIKTRFNCSNVFTVNSIKQSFFLITNEFHKDLNIIQHLFGDDKAFGNT